jgi:hypothetical protein
MVMAGCNYLVDSTPPQVAIDAPGTGTVAGEVAVRAIATDNESGIERIDILINGEQRASQTYELERGSQVLEYSWETTTLADGPYSIVARALNGFGMESTSEAITVQVSSAGLPGAPPAAPAVSLDASQIEPGPLMPAPTACANSGEGCFEDVVSVPVKVDLPSGTSLENVELSITGSTRGTTTRTTTTFPYVFEVDTRQFPNNEVLTLRAQARTTAGGVGTSNEILLTVFNQAPAPTLSVTAPTDGEVVRGELAVSVSLSRLSDSGYTLDINDNGRIDENEGFFVEIVDFTGEALAERRINSSTTSVNSTQSGSYTIAVPIDTTTMPNDTYTLRVTLPVRFMATNEIVSLSRVISISTENVNLVPPSLLILSPNDRNGTLTRTIRDPLNAYVTVQVSDDVGLAFVEVRIFSGEADNDSTPSRFIKGYSPPVLFDRVSLPLNISAHPHLWNSSELSDPDHFYTLRVIAQDGNGNRTFQDVRAKIERDPSVALTLSVPASVRLPNFVPLSVSSSPPLPSGTLYEYLVRATDSTFTPAFDSGFTTSTSIGYGVEAGSYAFVVQATTPDGDIYLSNQNAVVVLPEEE